MSFIKLCFNYDTSLCYNNSIIIIEEEQFMTSILIVEDDNDINNLICNTLKAEGYQCERAFDGKRCVIVVKNTLLFNSIIGCFTGTYTNIFSHIHTPDSSNLR